MILAALPIVSDGFREKLFYEGTWRFYFIGLPVIFFIIALCIQTARDFAHGLSRCIAEKIVKYRNRKRELLKGRQERKGQW